MKPKPVAMPTIVWTFNREPTWPPGFRAQLPGLLQREIAGAKKATGVSIANQRLRESEFIAERLQGLRAMRGLTRGADFFFGPKTEPT